MEICAAHMKRNGSYMCRTLSFENCTFQVIEDAFSAEVLSVYDRAARLWQNMSVQLQEGLKNETLAFHWGYRDEARNEYLNEPEENRRMYGVDDEFMEDFLDDAEANDEPIEVTRLDGESNASYFTRLNRLGELLIALSQH